MGRKGKKPKAVTGMKENPIFRSDTFVLKGDGSKVMAASGSVDANIQDSISVDSTLVSCNNIEVNVNNGEIGIAGGVYHNGNLDTDGNHSREVGGEMMMAAGFVSTDTGVEKMAPGLENDASCEIVAPGLENDARCEMVARSSEIGASLDMVATGSKISASENMVAAGSLSTDASCETVARGSEIDANVDTVAAGSSSTDASYKMVAAGSAIHASLEGMAVGSVATDDSSRHPNLSGSKPGLRLNVNNIEVNIQSGANVHIGGVYRNCTFYAGGTSSGSNVVMSSGSASEYADLERMVTGSEAAELRRVLDVWNSGTLLNQSNIKVNVHSGATVNIGCVYYNTNFVAGGKPSRPTVASESRVRHQVAPQRSSDAATAPHRPLEKGANAPGPSAK